MKRLVVVPAGWPCTLAECPPGLFLFEGKHLGFKTEYKSPIQEHRGPHDEMRYDIEVFVAASGETFWGGHTVREERQKLVVQPCTYEWEEYEE